MRIEAFAILILLLSARLMAAEPAIAALADLDLAEDFPVRCIPISGLAGEGSLTVTARSSDPLVLPHPYVVHTSPASTGQLVLAPAAEASGSAVVTVTVTDGLGRSAATAFTVGIAAVNDAPRFTLPAELVVQEDASVVLTLADVACGPADEAGQTLTFSIPGNAFDVVTLVSAVYDPATATAQLGLRLAADWQGFTHILVTVTDDGGTVGGGLDSFTADLLVTIQAVNDPPVLGSVGTVAVSRGGLTVLDAGVLAATDPDRGSVMWTLETLPVHGGLYLSWVNSPLGAGNVFSQDMIAAGQIVYRHDGGPSTDDAFSVAIHDGSLVVGPVTVPVEIHDSTRPEVHLMGFGYYANWSEGDAPGPVAPEAVITDGDSADFRGGSIVATIVSGWRPGDVLEFADSGSGDSLLHVTAGWQMTLGSATIGIAGPIGQDGLFVSFVSHLATTAVAQRLVRAITFRNTTWNPGPDYRGIQIVVDDGQAGPSEPVLASVRVWPVDDPPVPALGSVALPVAAPREIVLTATDDQDVPVLTWAVVGQPSGVVAAFSDPASGRLALRATGGVGGVVAVTVSDGVNPPVAADLPVVVTGFADPRPHAAGEFPGQVFRGETLAITVPFDCRQLADADLDFALAGDAPAGLQVERSTATTAVVTWLVPDAEPLIQRTFTLLAIDRTTLACGILPVVLPVRPRPGGDN